MATETVLHPAAETPPADATDPAARHAAILADPRLLAAGASRRMSLMRSLQRSAGNSYAERVLAHTPPVQRRENPQETTDREPTEAEKQAALAAAAAAEGQATGAQEQGAQQGSQARAAGATEKAAGESAKARAATASAAAGQAATEAKSARADNKPTPGRAGQAGGAAPAAEAAGAAGSPPTTSEHAPASPADDPGFQATVGKVKQTAAKKRAHQPAASKAAAAQAAAESPAAELAGKAQANQVGKVQQAPAPPFDAAGFKARLMERIAALAPKNTQEADNFKESGKLGGVKDEMKGAAAEKQEAATGPIEQENAAAPDAAGVEPKPVTPLAAEEAGAPPADLGAQAAAPKSRTAAEVEQPIRESSNSVEQEMRDNDISDEQLKKSNEPEFQSAVEAKDEAKTHAATAPGEFRQAESAQLEQARGDAKDATAEQSAAMHGDRAAALTQVGGKQTQTKSKDEQQRAEIAAQIQTIYGETKSNVERILGAVDAKVEAAFDSGAAAARQTFENYVDSRVEAYKQRRYGGFFGWARWAKDKLLGMPGEVNTIYSAGRNLYLREMDAVVDRVTAIIGSAVTEARAEVARGRQRIQEYLATLPKNLQAVGEEAAGEIGDKFDELESSIDEKQHALIDTLANKYNENLQAVDARIDELKAANQGLVQKALNAVVGVVKTILKLKEMLLGVLARAADVIGKIIKDPIGFLGNLVSAVKAGLNGFIAKLPQYLKEGLMGWLFGALAEAGIQMPETFDLKGILGLVLQLLGLTYANIRARAVKVVGEKTVARLEQTVEIFKLLISEGPAGLWKFIQDKLSSLKEQVMGEIQDFIITKVITAGITWLLSLLNPASAFIKACKMIYDVIMFFVERGSQIMELVNAVLNSVSEIASGAIDKAAGMVEKALGKAIPVAISFLASLLGLGGIAGKIRGVIEKIQKPVGSLIDKVVGGALKVAKKLGVTKIIDKAKSGVAWAKGKGKQAVAYVKKKAEQGKAWAKKKIDSVKQKVKGSPKDADERLQKGMAKGVAAVEKFKGKPLSEAILKPSLFGIKKFYRLSMLEPFEKDGFWAVRGDVQRAVEKKTTVKKSAAALKDEVTKALTALGLSKAAIGRIFAKAPEVSHIKGQLLEEIKGGQVAAATPAGKVPAKPAQAPAKGGKGGKSGKAAEPKPVFFAGHRVTDANGRQFSDGIIGAWQGDVLHISQVIEAKAGSPAAQGLSGRRQQLSKADWREIYREAAEELRERNPALKNTPTSVVVKQHRAEVREIVRALYSDKVQTEEGQARSDIERLVPNFGAGFTTIKIDGKPVKATGSPSSTTIVGVMPKDVDSSQIKADVAQSGLSFKAEHTGMTEPQLYQLALQVAKATAK